MNHIIKPLAYDHIEEWYECTVLSKEHPELPLSSQSISNLLDSIGNSAVHIDFAKYLIILTEGEQIVMERTKKQKEILNALGICA
ncbi:Mobile element protein [Methanosarcina siciliae T4/M]|uniref:Mobile element protein n=2 Tax=Methanosarcina siciliae TaxID=38027 RepID=A0A0E3PDX0_9EURY|nr:Mobile element protein [Methanosarcina siciliae T4/M]AKB32714.1 Mobile element protein [Methanosarcina siciliae HI350]